MEQYGNLNSVMELKDRSKNETSLKWLICKGNVLKN